MQTVVEFKKSELQRLQKNLEEEKTSKDATLASQSRAPTHVDVCKQTSVSLAAAVEAQQQQRCHGPLRSWLGQTQIFFPAKNILKTLVRTQKWRATGVGFKAKLSSTYSTTTCSCSAKLLANKSGPSVVDCSDAEACRLRATRRRLLS